MSRYDQAQIVLVPDRSGDVHRDANDVWGSFLERHLQPRDENVVAPAPFADALHLLDVCGGSGDQSNPTISLQSISRAHSPTTTTRRQGDDAPSKSRNRPCSHVLIIASDSRLETLSASRRDVSSLHERCACTARVVMAREFEKERVERLLLVAREGSQELLLNLLHDRP